MNINNSIPSAALDRATSANQLPISESILSPTEQPASLPGGTLSVEQLDGKTVSGNDDSAASPGSLPEQSITSLEQLASEPSAMQRLTAEPTTTDRLATGAGLTFLTV